VKRFLGLLAIALVAAIGGYLFGLYSYPRDTWPLGLLREIRYRGDPPPRFRGFYGEAGRLVSYPGKVVVPCPAPGPNTAVILAIGQSNIGNHAEKRAATRYPEAVVNLFDGKCFQAASPLLGATGNEGEFLTLLGDRLVVDGLYRNVVIVASAIGATSIARWQRGGDLNGLLLSVLAGMPAVYQVTQVLWVQGEHDFARKRPSEDYTRSFRSLLDTLTEAGVTAPVFLAIASKCDVGWTPDNPTANAQRALIDGRRVFLGVDGDALFGDEDRRSDKCHFGTGAQLKAADAFARAIAQVRTGVAPRSAAPSPSAR
jgi:Carbohydrate esterase, sialic acid-specific acetylesterase